MHSVEASVGTIGYIPIRIPEQEMGNKLKALVSAIIEKQKINPQYPYYKSEQKAIDNLVNRLYGLEQDEIREVDMWYCRRYPLLADAQGVLDAVTGNYERELRRADFILQKPHEYWQSNPILKLIASGESKHLEFKETLEADSKTGNKYPNLKKEALKTICAFGNAAGGSLLIGVSDSGEIRGLEKDYKLCSKKQDEDSFELKLRSIIKDRIEPSPIGLINISFVELREGTVCRVDINRSDKILHVDNKEVYVRDGNQSLRLEGRELTDWITKRTTPK